MVEEKKLVKILTVRPELCPDEFILIFSSNTCVSQLTTWKRQEAETAGGVSPRGYGQHCVDGNPQGILVKWRVQVWNRESICPVVLIAASLRTDSLAM